jgi:salicylate hydroxylase
VPTFNKSRVLITGDAAHATSPHHGAGAGFCIEDSAILASLLADESVRSQSDLEHAFTTFNDRRKERGQWLVQSSRWIGDCYERRAHGIGSDFAKIEKEIHMRNGIIANVDVEQLCAEACEDLRMRLKRQPNARI